MNKEQELLPPEPPTRTDPMEARRGDIPPETWALIQQAGHKAAERLLDLIEKPAFSRMKVTDQARLIELALNRAYGPPIQKSATLALSGKISDAVADELARLSEQDLPENR